MRSILFSVDTAASENVSVVLTQLIVESTIVMARDEAVPAIAWFDVDAIDIVQVSTSKTRDVLVPAILMPELDAVDDTHVCLAPVS